MKFVFDAEAVVLAIKVKRASSGLRASAIEAGTSAATLSRIERGKKFDIETFTRICNWLEKEPGAFFKEV